MPAETFFQGWELYFNMLRRDNQWIRYSIIMGGMEFMTLLA